MTVSRGKKEKRKRKERAIDDFSGKRA